MDNYSKRFGGDPSRTPLPLGTWIVFHNLDPETTEQDIADAIESRTGVAVELNRIGLIPHSEGRIGAKVSLSTEHISDIMRWALGDDEINGRQITIARQIIKSRT